MLSFFGRLGGSGRGVREALVLSVVRSGPALPWLSQRLLHAAPRGRASLGLVCGVRLVCPCPAVGAGEGANTVVAVVFLSPHKMPGLQPQTRDEETNRIEYHGAEARDSQEGGAQVQSRCFSLPPAGVRPRRALELPGEL